MKQLAKGILYGLAFFLPGFYLLSHGSLPDVLPYVAQLADLPVVTRLTDKYRTEINLTAADFVNGLQRFLQQEPSDKTVSDFKNTSSWTWQRAEIEAVLNQKLGKRQQHRRRQFLDYIQQYAPLALAEMSQHRIPASVTLAQGILETSAGNSYIARAARNHFGIKCYRTKDFNRDGRIDRTDFYPHSLAYDCLQIADDNTWDHFQVYQTVAQSYRHHSLLLAQERRYNWMVGQYSGRIGKDCTVEGSWFGSATVPYYAAWCIGLKKSGYATSKTYAQKLTYLIETYELWRFDYQLILSM
jgi:flagellum-specific peptidoglycan hydrolase FlgJ